MAQEIWVNTDGSASGFKEVTSFYVNTDGSASGWKEVTEGWVNTDGSASGWKQFYTNAIPPTITDIKFQRLRAGTPCAASFCESCVYWTIADGASGDVLDIARSSGGGSYVTWADDIAYDADDYRVCEDYALTGDAKDASTAGCIRDTTSVKHRLTLFRASVQQDEDFSGTLTCCNCEEEV